MNNPYFRLCHSLTVAWLGSLADWSVSSGQSPCGMSNKQQKRDVAIRRFMGERSYGGDALALYSASERSPARKLSTAGHSGQTQTASAAPGLSTTRSSLSNCDKKCCH